MIDVVTKLIKQFLPFAQERMGFSSPPKLFLRNDSTNAKNPFGKTAYYEPDQKSITVYITDRHPKDVMRSISHELVHHAQNCRGEFDKPHQMGDGYAQNDSHMREMERQAYEIGNMCFRDWEDSIKNTIYNEHLQKGDKKMSTKDWKNKEIGTLLSEAWGFKFNSLEEFNEFNGEGELQAEAEHDDEKEMKEGDNPEDDDAGKSLEESPSHPAEDREGPRASGRRVKAGDGQRLAEEEEDIEEGKDKKPMHDHDGNPETPEIPAYVSKAEADAAKKKKGKKGKQPPQLAKAQGKKPTKEQIEALVKKALQEAVQKRKG